MHTAVHRAILSPTFILSGRRVAKIGMHGGGRRAARDSSAGRWRQRTRCKDLRVSRPRESPLMSDVSYTGASDRSAKATAGAEAASQATGTTKLLRIANTASFAVALVANGTAGKGIGVRRTALMRCTLPAFSSPQVCWLGIPQRHSIMMNLTGLRRKSPGGTRTTSCPMAGPLRSGGSFTHYSSASSPSSGPAAA